MEADVVLANRYRLSHLLASGGMGEVWQAHDTVLDRKVAVKVLSAGLSDPAALERFRREAVTMAALQHPNTVMVFDIGTHQRWTFIVMELLPGPTLAQLVATRGPLPEAEVARLGVQVAAGLGAAHRAGIVHRDIKPGNLMLGPADVLKVVDFGVARLSQATAPALTATNTVVGSALYVSPEQAAGKPADERSDLYALGCVLMTLATGRPPFESEQLVGALHQHVHSAPPLLRTRRPEASVALESLIGELLAKRPEDRPASAAEVESRLRGIEVAAQEAPTAVGPLASGNTARLVEPTAVMTTVVAAPGEGSHRLASAPLGKAGRGRAWWIAAAALVSATALAAVALTQNLGSGGEADSLAPSPSATTPATPTATPTASATTPTATPRDNAGQEELPPGQTRGAGEATARGKSDEKKPAGGGSATKDKTANR